MGWLHREHGVRRWCIVGDDYVWPRRTARAARAAVRALGAQLCDEVFVPLGTSDFGAAIERVERCGADAVLMLLVGEDAAHFNRAFARAGLDTVCRRLSTLMDENTLLASGADCTRGITTAAGYFETLTTPESLEFGLRYTRRFGSEAPALNSLGESCHEGLLLLAALAERAGSTDVRRLCAAAETVSYEGPRGELRLRDRHLDQRIYLAEADGLRFDVLAQL
jgi:ABC-type branched-subunit amino acid transport system substrate-binding protein